MSKRLIVYWIFVISLFMVGCTTQANVKVSSAEVSGNTDKGNANTLKINELLDKLNSYETEIKYAKIENDYYKNYINKLIVHLSEEELLKLAKDEWQYSLEIDNKKIPENGVIELNKPYFKIVLSEQQVTFEVLPTDLHNKGQISGETYGSHIKFLNIKPDYTEGSDGTVVSAQSYAFNNIASNSTVKIEITKELQERLGLNTNIIRINVKY